MFIIYILLIIIAIGVLLISDTGKSILKYGSLILGIVGTLCLIIILSFLGYELFFETDFYDKTLGPILAIIIVTAGGFVLLYSTYIFIKDIIKDRRKIIEKTKQITFKKIYTESEKKVSETVSTVLSILKAMLIVALMLIYFFILIFIIIFGVLSYSDGNIVDTLVSIILFIITNYLTVIIYKNSSNHFKI